MSLLEDSERLRIPFGDIKEATKNFTTLIGKGGYGLVYRGELRLSGKLTTVAVKRLQVSLSGQGFKEFLTEIQLLTRYKHPNLISLIGFCNEGEEKILIYEYAENGSLDKYLSSAENRHTLTWKQRLNICVNAARGLNYLHNEAAVNERVIHRDIKSANVLLDQNWKAMISDLGLSKLGRANEKDTYLITNASGTYGYCDPVYRKTGILTKESDVYSFGVVLFEVLCGRLCFKAVDNEHRFLPELAQSYYKKGQINEIIDPELQDQLDSDSLKKFSDIAFKCIHNTRKQRPSLRWVLKKLEELEKTLDLQISEQNNRKRKQHSSSGPANSTSTMMYGADETGGLASSVNRRLFLSPQIVVNHPLNMLPVAFQGHASHSQAFDLSDDLPQTVARTLNQGSATMSMDFHPIQQTILLVGTNMGDIGLWEVGSREKLVFRNFKVWDPSACSLTFKASLVKDPGVSVNRVIWSPDGWLFGVAYSRHIVQLYSYHGSDDVRQHLEIDAHVGGVNDLGFSHPNKQLSVITCGDDKTIKVWDAATGAKQYTFEGHGAPVYSVCPHQKENIQFIFSTDLDGKIKAWLYDNMGSRVDYEAPGRSFTTMAYSADGRRLFSCGTSKDGESHIAEWNEVEVAVKRTYVGFRKPSLGVVQFDTTKNCFLAAGDDFSIKYWDMDDIQLLTSVDAGGGLPASPRIRFNKDGTLLAVSANENGIKILSNSDGLRLLRTFENLTYDAASRAPEEPNDMSKIWKLTEISESSQCRSLKLPENMRVTKISRLIYTNSGNAILALASNGIHLLWKWQHSERNSRGKATASVSPQLWKPSSGILMTNDDAKTNLFQKTISPQSVSCFVLTKNDSYVMSATGGKISLFNMMTFKTMTTFMPPPPAATFLAFHPQDNNIIAIGMDDSTIQIYNIRTDGVKSKLRGHSKRITGLAFSHAVNVLVSSGADSQICVWSSDGWEKQKAIYLQIPPGRAPTALSDTRVQFHNDQTHFLVVHETQLAIVETTKLECVKQWLPHKSSAPISDAMFSCDNQLVYVSFLDATVFVLTASNLLLRCCINPSAYLPSNVPSNANVHPLVIAAHPQEPNQFALGLSDGAVHVFEPRESEGEWGVPPPAYDGSPSNVAASSVGGPGEEQIQR